MVKIIISGICGKMGSRILALAQQDKEIEIVAGLEAKNHQMIGKKIQPSNIIVESELEKVIDKSDVLIEFTNPQATIEHIKILETFKKACVIGTTGLSEEQVSQIKNASKKIPIVFSPNMSIGVNLLFKLASEVAKILQNYDVEIVELHHNKKKDAPSGTALKLAEKIKIARQKKLKEVFSRAGETGPRKPDEIGIFAVRAGDIVGEHTVIFAGTGERLELIHKAHSRDTFASGALTAAKWIVNRQPGLYDMTDVLGLK
ncbi:MAG: 4-hydroxy-tetrahydrodipicolinate reductase [Endomicrobiia bacterium]